MRSNKKTKVFFKLGKYMALIDHSEKLENGTKKSALGYTYIVHDGMHYPEHRLIWEQHYQKEIPEGLVINHKNGDKKDNRIENLETATPEQNYFHYVLMVVCKYYDKRHSKNMQGKFIDFYDSVKNEKDFKYFTKIGTNLIKMWEKQK